MRVCACVCACVCVLCVCMYVCMYVCGVCVRVLPHLSIHEGCVVVPTGRTSSVNHASFSRACVRACVRAGVVTEPHKFVLFPMEPPADSEGSTVIGTWGGTVCTVTELRGKWFFFSGGGGIFRLGWVQDRAFGRGGGSGGRRSWSRPASDPRNLRARGAALRGSTGEWL